MKKNFFYIILFIIAIFFIGYLLNQRNNSDGKVIQEIFIKDTIEKIKYSEPIIITKVRTKIIKTSDSQIVTNPFISKLDTIINQDTITAVYEFPENMFSIKFHSAPDTVTLRKIELIQNNKEEKKWWEVPLYITGGIILGFLIGSAGK